jgi:predicted dehydrogenase
MSVRVGIVGCGLIGRRRAAALAGARLAACADVDQGRAETLAQSQPGVRAAACWQDLVGSTDIDLVIVATSNDALASVSVAAIEAGKHVLVEKPAGRSVAEIDRIAGAARRHGRLVRVGFNHRYHPAFIAARDIVDAGTIGPLMFVRGRYGHGGRVGYDREWRADPARSGGGELIDQGVHLIDLSRWFLGPFADMDGVVHTYFWDMAVDDNAFLRLTTPAGQVAFLHASCTEWKNLFSFEIYGRRGKLHIEGLGGSYGIERLAHYQMRPEMGPPDTVIHEYPQADRSCDVEFAEFLEDLRLGREPAAGLEAARAALEVVETVYSRSGSAGRPSGRLETPSA